MSEEMGQGRNWQICRDRRDGEGCVGSVCEYMGKVGVFCF